MLHVDRHGQLRYLSGYDAAVRLSSDPTSAPTVYINPLLALQAFLLDSGSPLVVEHMRADEGVYIFKFEEQIPPSHVAQIARQGWVKVRSEEGWTGTINSSGDKLPTVYLHGVKQMSVSNSLEMLVHGFDYGETSEP